MPQVSVLFGFLGPGLRLRRNRDDDKHLFWMEDKLLEMQAFGPGLCNGFGVRG
jgi:hypothetical protein